MKDSFDADSRQALINYRLDRAYETLREARIMEKESCFNAAMQRVGETKR